MKLINKSLAIRLPTIMLSVFAVLIFVMPAVSFADHCANGGTHNAQGLCPAGSNNQQPAGTANTPPVKIYNPLGGADGKGIDIPDLIRNILTGALKIFIPVVALAIIYCGFLFVFALGNPEKLKKAKDALLYTLIGTAVLFGAWAIANLIVTTVKSLG